MFRTITCEECKRTGSFPFEVQWEIESSRCEVCQQDTGRYKKMWFCSWKCLCEWVNKNKNHKKHTFVWDGWSSYKYCKVCGETVWEKDGEWEKLRKNYLKSHKGYDACWSMPMRKTDWKKKVK